MPARAVNDFTIRVATVNGSGSQSSNLVLTNAIARLGIPVAPKNVFPSNIEGLPTWFDVRVSALGYQCRARDFDVLVALNAVTWQQDVAGVKSGGAVIHEESFPCKGDTLREDLTYYAVPFAALAKEHFADKGDLRKYLMNMIYVGVIAQLLEMPMETVEESLRAQFRNKVSAVELNMAAVKVGVEYAQQHLEKHDPWRVVPMSGKTEGLMFMEGNRAAALGCVMGGCTVAAWYPITPSSSLCEYFIQYCDRYRVNEESGERNVAIVQAEDELAAA
ncbi:MAG: 2-oxoacid:acceptor oxidoreductase family protein, partial [Candidatus Cybelea sp.]